MRTLLLAALIAALPIAAQARGHRHAARDPVSHSGGHGHGHGGGSGQSANAALFPASTPRGAARQPAFKPVYVRPAHAAAPRIPRAHVNMGGGTRPHVSPLLRAHGYRPLSHRHSM